MPPPVFPWTVQSLTVESEPVWIPRVVLKAAVQPIIVEAAPVPMPPPGLFVTTQCASTQPWPPEMPFAELELKLDAHPVALASLPNKMPAVPLLNFATQFVSEQVSVVVNPFSVLTLATQPVTVQRSPIEKPAAALAVAVQSRTVARSEERRVGKECRGRWGTGHEKKIS